jgi:hypothetical protein
MNTPTNREDLPLTSPAITYLIAFVVFVVILAFGFMFGVEIWCSWRPPIPAWVLALHNPLSALASLVGGIVAVTFAVKPPPEYATQMPRQIRFRANFASLGRFAAPFGSDRLKEIMGAIYSVAYVLLGLAAIGTWAYLGSSGTPLDVKSLATNFAGMVTPIVLAFFSR